MKKMLRALNLQLFADDPEQTEDRPFEIEDSVDTGPVITEHEDGSIEIEDDDDQSESNEGEEESEASTDGDNPQQEEVTDKPKKNETANAVIAERRKWQERMKALEKKATIADKVMTSAGITDVDTFQSRLDALETDRLQKQGLDPQTAQMIVLQQRQMQEMQQNMTKQKFDVEITKLKDDPFFSDIEDWRDELEPIALKTGQSLESVYMAQRGRERMKEYQREQEHRMQSSQQKKQAARVNTTSSGGAAKKSEKVNLSPDQMAMAKIAVKNGTFKSVDEYAKYVKK